MLHGSMQFYNVLPGNACLAIQQGHFSTAFCSFIHSSVKYSILIFFLFEHQLVCFLCFDILVDVVFIYNTTNAPTNVTTSSIAAAAHSSNTQHPAISNFQFIEKCLSSHHTITLPVHTSTHLRRKVFIYVTIERVQNNQQVCHC